MRKHDRLILELDSLNRCIEQWISFLDMFAEGKKISEDYYKRMSEAGIDGSQILQGEEVAGRVGALAIVRAVVQIVAVVVRGAHVLAHLQPLLQHIISLQTGSQTLVVAGLGDTLVAQIVSTGIVSTLIAGTAGRDGVLLTQTLAVNCIAPVVGNQQELCYTVRTCYQVTQFSVGLTLPLVPINA